MRLVTSLCANGKFGIRTAIGTASSSAFSVAYAFQVWRKPVGLPPKRILVKEPCHSAPISQYAR